MSRAARRHPDRHQRDIANEKVCISWCSGGLPEHGFMTSVTGVYRYDFERHQRLLKGSEIALEGGPRVAESRSQICDQFLTSAIVKGCEWLWMLDDDMEFEPDTLERLIEAADPVERPIVGGLCFAGGRGVAMKPTLYRFLTPQGDMEIIWDYPEDTLVKVDATGAACLLIHRNVLGAMRKRFGLKPDGSPNPYPWFQEGMVNSQGSPYGEDIAFFVKTNMLGIPLHVHTGIEIGHIKRTVLRSDMYKAQRAAQKVEEAA